MTLRLLVAGLLAALALVSTASADMALPFVSQHEMHVNGDTRTVLDLAQAIQPGPGSRTNPGTRRTANDDDRCRLPAAPGPCKANFEAYAFNPKDQTCRMFFWGGCGPAPFTTKEECEKTCAKR